METWTPKTKQDETWASRTQPVRVFDPRVFDNRPIFDTGSGVWADNVEQSEGWVAA